MIPPVFFEVVFTLLPDARNEKKNSINIVVRKN